MIADLFLPTKESIRKYLLNSPSDSPFRESRREELLSAIFKASAKYSLNPVYILAHAIHESGWGRSKIAKDKNNLFGYKAYDWAPYANAQGFKNYDECVDVVMAGVVKNYITPGGKFYSGATLEGMNKNYATDPNWSVNIRRLMNEIYNG